MNLSRLIATKFLVRPCDQHAEDTCGARERAKLRIAMERIACQMLEEAKKGGPQDQDAPPAITNNFVNLA